MLFQTFIRVRSWPPTAFFIFLTFFQTTKTQLVNFYSLPFGLLIFFNMSHCKTLCFFVKSCGIPKECLHDISSKQITCLFPGTHKLFHEPLFEIIIFLLSTLSVCLQMTTFSFHKSIFDIVSVLSLATSFVVSDNN